MNVYGTSNEVLMIRGVTFYRGEELRGNTIDNYVVIRLHKLPQSHHNSNTLALVTCRNLYGGALNIEGQGVPPRVTLELYKFDQKHADQCGAAIYFSPSQDHMVAGEAVFHLYVCVFTGNEAVNAKGEVWEQSMDANDICIDWSP